MAPSTKRSTQRSTRQLVPSLPQWSRFRRLSQPSTQNLRELLVSNSVNLSTPSGFSDRDRVRAITAGASTPLPVACLDPVLDGDKSARGAVFSKDLGTVLNEIAINYRDMVWCVTDDGLVMKVVEPAPDTAKLSAFDQIAGKLYAAMVPEGRLSQANLENIVSELDRARETLKANLQPKQWTQIALYNQKNARRPIKTFAAAIKQPAFATFVRRRMYVARDAYQQALQLPRKHLEKYDAHVSRDSSILF